MLALLTPGSRPISNWLEPGLEGLAQPRGHRRPELAIPGGAPRTNPTGLCARSLIAGWQRAETPSMTFWAGILGIAVSLLLILPAIMVGLRRPVGIGDDEDEDE